MARLTKLQTQELQQILGELELAKSQIAEQPGYADTTLSIAVGKLANMIVSDGFRRKG